MTLAIDQFLLKFQNDIDQLPTRDCQILQSLSTQISQNIFLTENQSKLLVKILNDNFTYFEKIEKNFKKILEDNLWSQPFRILQKIRKIYVDPVDIKIKIEFTFNKSIKERLSSLNSKINGELLAYGSKSCSLYSVPLSENNIDLLINEFKNYNFEIEEKILNFHQEIKNIRKENPYNFDIFNLKDEKLKKLIEDDAGEITHDNLIMLHDRKIRYQYTINEKIPEKSLKNEIAQRTRNKVFIDNEKFSLEEVFDVVKNLNRFPILMIFEGHEPIKDKKSLDLLTFSMSNSKILGDVGIYFRHPNSAEGNKFNSSIADLSFNKNLSENTKIAAIANNTLPKFMIKTGWIPQTIISFTNNFKNNKASAYFSNVDLLIYYNDKQPLNGDIDVIM